MTKPLLPLAALTILFSSCQSGNDNNTLSNKYLTVSFSESGIIRELKYPDEIVEFRKDSVCEGPALYLSGKKVRLGKAVAGRKQVSFTGKTQDAETEMTYSLNRDALVITAKIRNLTQKELPVGRFTLRLGINTEMDSYPHWNEVYFPTLMRCEKNFFWGYFMNPSGNILVVSSPDPVASWRHTYTMADHEVPHGGHMIYTTNLDLIHKGPLPPRHPQEPSILKAGEEREWTVYLKPVVTLGDVKPAVSRLCNAVMVDADEYTISGEGSFNIRLTGNVRSLKFITPQGSSVEKDPAEIIDFTPESGHGKYRLIAESKSGRVSEAVFSVRQPWGWYMQQARLNAIEQEQKAGSHTESWYGLFSMFLAQKYFPDETLLKITLDKFNELYPLMYDQQDMPKKIIVFGNLDLSGRIQNSACMASLLAAIYSTVNDTSYLARASRICDFLITKQDSRGAYRSGGNVHYTSVVYIAKSILEVCSFEKLLARENNIWQQRYERHFASAKQAVDELARSLDNIETEGELTYEDGMISCSYAQTSLMATLESDPVKKKEYLEAAQYLRKGHRCLSQLIVPDSRMNGASLRFWESQFDILSYANIVSSPHGWSAWRIYGLYYLYLETGDPDLLNQIFNALGSCVQVIDEKTGELRWGFCVDPFVEGDDRCNMTTAEFSAMKADGKPVAPHNSLHGNLLVKDHSSEVRENRGLRRDTVIGEDYLPMISQWYKAEPDTWVTGYWGLDGGCCDNDVHEIFKCMEEVVLCNAFIVELQDGSYKGYNCSVKADGRSLQVFPSEETISRVHFNLKKEKEATIFLPGGKTADVLCPAGMLLWTGQE